LQAPSKVSWHWADASCRTSLTAWNLTTYLVTAALHKRSFKYYTSESIDLETTFGKSHRFHIRAT